METGVGIGILIAFLAGIVSFASPCCLPLVPAYIGYMAGSQPDDGTVRRRAAFSQAVAFVLGFSAVFIALWASVGLIGYVLRDHVGLLRQVGGTILVFMGLHVAGAIDITALHREVRLSVGPMGGASPGFGQVAPSTPSHPRSALLGVVFAAGWTPCIGPILGGIIGLASVGASVAEGTMLLVAYATGLAIPFILVAVGATSVSHRLGWLRDHHTAVSAVTGVMLGLVGVLMITNTFTRLSSLFTPLGPWG
ncbi:MAG: cytochrome c biogenesis protein CcdA [Chloroflexota bacterium]